MVAFDCLTLGGTVVAPDNKAVIRRVFDAMNTKDFSILDEVIAPSFVNHDMPAPMPGPDGMKQMLGGFFAGFPDMHVNLDALVGDGDLVASRGTFGGTHRGEFMGVPATGKDVTVKFIDVWRVENGLAVENWVQLDIMGLMVQLGAVPPLTGEG
jgi:predicted ester cyclase